MEQFQTVLGDFVEVLAALLQEQKTDIPFQDERSWHELFYDLSTNTQSTKPGFMERLRFDWDGPYPKCQDLSEFLHALRRNARADARNFRFDAITIPDEIARQWQSRMGQLDETTRRFLDVAVQRAKEYFVPARTSP